VKVVDQVGFVDVHEGALLGVDMGFLCVYLRVQMGDGIIIFVFCLESLVVMGLRMVLKEIEKILKF